MASLFSGNAKVYGNAKVSGNAWVEKPMDFIHIAGFRFSVTIRNDGFASIGCQTKTIQEWLDVKFCHQREIWDEIEFMRMQSMLRPLFESYLPDKK